MNRKFKMGLAVITAAAMTMSPLVAFAAESEFGGQVEVGGDADLEYYDDNIISVTLPTSSIWDKPFAIDPQGALSITADDGKVVDAAKGKVVPMGVASIKNESSVPVNVVATLWIEKNSDGDASSVEFIANTGASALATSDKNQIALQLLATTQITNDDLSTLAGATKDHTLLANDKLTDKKDITANGKADAMEISFLLKEAKYILTQKDNKKGWNLDSSVTDNYSQVAFCVGGEVAQKADWSAFTGEGAEKIAMKAVFTLEEVDSATSVSDPVKITASAATAPTYFKTGESSVYEATSDSINIAAKVSTDYTVKSGADLVLPIDFGKGGKKVSVTGSVWATMGTGSMELVEGTDYEVTPSGITLKGDSTNLWVFEWPTEGNVVGFSCVDGSGNSIWVTVTFDTVE